MKWSTSRENKSLGFPTRACLAIGLQAPRLYFFSILNSTVHEISTAHKIKISTNQDVSCFKSLRCCIFPANKCQNANSCWHVNINEQDKFRAQLSMRKVL